MNNRAKKRVSYIITTKNRSKYFERTLQNIREFITPQDELLILDGGSSDKTLSLIKKNKDIITYFESEPDFGEAHALNKGILLSTGKYIKVLTDDDYIYPKAMKKAISVLEKNPQIDAVQCGGEAYTIDPKTGKEDILFYEQVFDGIEIANNLLHVTTYCPCGLGLILTRKIISRAGLFDTTFRAVDLNYISKLILCKANFKYLNISLYKHYNYAHSGENVVKDIHRDEARVYLDHAMWEQTLRVETPVLLKVFGLDKTSYGEELLRSIKVLDFLRRKGFVLPLFFLSSMASLRSVGAALKERIKHYKRAEIHHVAPLSPIRDGKFW